MTRGADVSSDHHTLMTTVRLRLKRFTNVNSTRTKYNVGLLRNEDTSSFPDQPFQQVPAATRADRR